MPTEDVTMYALALSCDGLRALWANEAYLSLIEEASGTRDIVGRPFGKFAPMTTETGFTAKIEEVARTGEPYEITSYEIADAARPAIFWGWWIDRVPTGNGDDCIVLVTGLTSGRPTP